MGRISLDLGALAGMDDAIGPGAFKIFAEATVLGLKNQPFYYEDITKRIPIMAGIHIPTFKLLDILSLQVEYYGNQFYNSTKAYYWNGMPVPNTNEEQTRKAYYENDPKDWDEDNIKWSVFAKKSITSGLKVFVQAASDHMRTIDNAFFFAQQPVYHKPAHWYYLTRVDFGF
jgi:hypothetical protein